MITTLGWILTACVLIVYVGFPVLLLLLARVRPRPHRRGPIRPTVSVVIAARNEVGSIADKVRSVLACSWDPDRLEIVVVSDGSTDGTDDAVRALADPRVRLIGQEWLGKAAALERGVAATTGEILVFTDANSMLLPDTIERLTEHFADPDVGGVAGNQVYDQRDPSGSRHDVGERGYWALDRIVKRAQSAVGDTVSATGALYAIRREHFVDVPVGVTDDFYISTGVIAAGRRLVFATDAVAVEPTAASSGREFERKVRIMTRGLRGVVRRRSLLDVRRHGLYSVQLLWHKVLRRLVAIPLLALVVLSPWLIAAGGAITVVGAGTLLAAVLGAIGAIWPSTANLPVIGRALGLLGYLCMVNAAALVAVTNILRGKQIDRWTPKRVDR